MHSDLNMDTVVLAFPVELLVIRLAKDRARIASKIYSEGP